MNLVKKPATGDRSALHSPICSGNSSLYPKIWHILSIPIAWVSFSSAPTCHRSHDIDTAATQRSGSNQSFLYNLIYLVHCHLNRLALCRLTFIQVVFQLLLILRLSFFSLSAAGNWSILLPASFSLQLRQMLTVFQIPSPHRGQRKSKTQSPGNRHQTLSLFVPFNSEWKFPVQETALTQQQLLKTFVWTSAMSEVQRLL